MIEVEAPDGTVVEFPDDTPRDVMRSAMAKRWGAPKQEMVGFGERGQREQEMPLDQDARKELAIAKGMARERPNFGAGDVFQQNYVFGLGDEAKALGAGVGNMLGGNGFQAGYDVEKEIQKRLGQEYAQENPKTDFALGVGGMLAGGLPAAPSKVAGLWNMMKEGGKIAGTQGAIQGAAEGEGLEGRATGALIGGGLGLGIGAGAPQLKEGVKALARPAVNTARAAINPEKEAARRLGQAATMDTAAGSGLDDVARYKARQAGNPIINADRGEATTALARSAANQSPQARSILDDAVKPRFQTQVERIDDTLKSLSTMGGKPEQFMELAEDAARIANRKFYQDAYSKGSKSIWTPELERLTASPEVQTALKSAIKKAASNELLDGFGAMNPRVMLNEADELVFTGKGGLPSYPDLRLWDLTKRELDRMGKMAARNSDSDARIYKGLAHKLKSELTSMGDMGQSYQKALKSAAAQFGAENAYEAGMKFAAAKGGTARESIKGLSKLSPRERKLFKEGYIQAVRDRLKEQRSNRDATLFTINSPGELERARVALGKKGAQQLQAQVAVEEAMDAVRKAMGNSTTARQLAELGAASAAGSGGMWLSGNSDPTSLTLGALMGAGTKAGYGKVSNRLQVEIAKQLASNDPAKVQALIRAASQSPKYLAAVHGVAQALKSAAGRAATEQVAQ
jgi:hypothetical protein